LHETVRPRALDTLLVIDAYLTFTSISIACLSTREAVHLNLALAVRMERRPHLSYTTIDFGEGVSAAIVAETPVLD
jgi:hypothetical protein